MPDLLRRTAACLDREKPCSLPVQAPNKFKFMLNLNPAKVIGLDVPGAEEAIEQQLVISARMLAFTVLGIDGAPAVALRGDLR